MARIAVISGFNTKTTLKGSFSIVLTHTLRLHADVNKGGFARGRNCDNSYLKYTVGFQRSHALGSGNEVGGAKRKPSEPRRRGFHSDPGSIGQHLSGRH